ncbi:MULTISPECIES: ATP-binding protein [Olsenella]|uniref:hypothetical protein n=1 Tax=Olsenella TaxID=133925 RepID=UPI000231ED8C|nr:MULTISPECIES: hypothetical protein [Olsenella]EHF01647.1 hypothetical protein HMPREF1008_01271 [Olsenella sp. oral taxon 809 str. F0356]KXB62325.1 hypothetical protein HMPREF1868_01412 [Olsenella sp. DNF00959]
MTENMVRLSVPAEAKYARAVRMTAASLAVACDMSVDDVEDVRMAAEEGFVYCCATRPESCDISFRLGERAVRMDFVLGEGEPDESEGGAGEDGLEMVGLLLSAICDEFDITEEGVLHLAKGTVVAHA